ncbi:MAG: GH116 family glycosyl-hydrolase, partial [Armatimonadota bacterium]|nr:GH116 family glycosyl-hydrolase [Armatimonadota bacterium]
MKKAFPYPSRVLAGEKRQRVFSGANAVNVALPLGGIGAGCICLNGVGGLQDFSIRHRPATSAMPDGHATQDAAFAVLHLPGPKPITRLVEGPFPDEKKFGLGMKTQGYRGGGHEGLPRFAESTFCGEYPFGMVRLRDPQ